LLEAAHEPKRLVELRGGHNDALLVSRETFAQAVEALLQHSSPGRADADPAVPE
jgi:PHD/YefM family antitoxin component YafN of YafNO toxin-antitoxin module